MKGTKTKADGQLRTLQAGRGLAAVAVVLHHAAYATGIFVTPLPNAPALIFHQGLLGVDFFFVLSGFIILNAHFDDDTTAAALNVYAWKRIIRIFVPYVPITAALIAAYLLIPELSRNVREWGWLTSIFLVPSRYPPALAAAWTLVHEVLFYAIFALYFFSRRVFALGAAVWVVAMLLNPSSVVDGEDPEPAMTAILNPINLEFCFGLACALGYRFANPRLAPWLVLSGLMTTAFFFVELGENERIVFGLGMALLVLGFAFLEKGAGLRVPASLVGLGDASYAVYLIHVPVISLVVRLAAHTPLLSNWLASLCFCSACSIVLGCAYYRLYERPALAAARGVVLRRKRPTSEARLSGLAGQ